MITPGFRASLGMRNGTIAATVVLLLAGSLLMLIQWIDIRREVTADAEAQARVVASGSAAAVMFRDAAGARETLAPPWRNLVGIYRRLEARGEIRGGRFVNGFVGEQFALPQAVDALRAIRRNASSEQMILIAAADPLNLAGIVSAAARVSPYSNQMIAYRDGIPVATGLLGELLSRLQRPAARERL